VAGWICLVSSVLVFVKYALLNRNVLFILINLYLAENTDQVHCRDRSVLGVLYEVNITPYVEPMSVCLSFCDLIRKAKRPFVAFSLNSP